MNYDRTIELASRLIEGSITREEEQELENLLSGEPGMAAELRRQAAINTLLKARGKAAQKNAIWEMVADEIENRRRAVLFRRSMTALAAAACLVAVVAFWLVKNYTQPIPIAHTPPAAPSMPTPLPVPEEPLVATILKVEGSLEILTDAGAKAAVAGEQIREGMRLRTGSGPHGAMLEFAGGVGRAEMKQETEIALKGGRADGGFTVDLAVGEIEVWVNKRGTPFTVATAAGEARALGTQYRVRVIREVENEERMENMSNPMKTLGAIMMVAVVSGVVDVSNPFGSVTLSGGQTAMAADNEKPRSNPGGGVSAWSSGSAAPGVAINVQGVGNPAFFGATYGGKGKGMTFAYGEIKEVHADYIILTINGNVWKKGEGFTPAPVDDTFMVTDKTKILLNGEEVKLEKLSEGMKASVNLKKEGTGFVAESINVSLIISGVIKSVGEDSFVLTVNNYVPSKEANGAMELKKEDWTVLVDDNTKKMSMGQKSGEDLPDLNMSELNENDSVQVWYAKKETNDKGEGITVTATKVLVFGKTAHSRSPSALKGQNPDRGGAGQ